MPAQWTVEAAKDNFTEMVNAARKGEPQFLSEEGQKELVLLPKEIYENMGTDCDSAAFVDMLLAIPKGEVDFLEGRDDLKLRDVEF